MRTFIAIPIPDHCKKLLDQLQQPLRASGADVRWTLIQNIHLTLKFLGEVDPGTIPLLVERLRGALGTQSCFSLRLRGVGGFPDLRNPRVIWCGIEGDVERLMLVYKDVDQACAQAGFSAEQRPFQPHLTLGRVRGKRNLHRLLDCIKIGADHESSFEAREVCVYQSTLTPHGSIYKMLAGLDLASPRPFL
jgi:RNA 2',3'-cyclic 3'-phosphodiesterase